MARLDCPKLTKVTRKGQVTIPEEIREAYGISEGDFMLVGATKGLIMLKKLALPSWKELFDRGEKFAERGHITGQQILKAVKETRRSQAQRAQMMRAPEQAKVQGNS